MIDEYCRKISEPFTKVERHDFGDFNFIERLTNYSKIDVMCQHGRFARDPLLQMLGQKAKFITILRDPLDQFMSMWNFYSFEDVFGMDLEAWLLANEK